MRAPFRVIAFNGGLALVGLSVLLPWAEVAGSSYDGPGFANLLLRLPEIRPLGEHLTVVAWLWYLIPVGAILAWGSQFTRWPPHPGWPGRIALVLLVVPLVAVTLWLAVRDVGFPAPGPLLALLGAGCATAAAWLPGACPSGGGRVTAENT